MGYTVRMPTKQPTTTTILKAQPKCAIERETTRGQRLNSSAVPKKLHRVWCWLPVSLAISLVLGARSGYAFSTRQTVAVCQQRSDIPQSHLIMFRTTTSDSAEHKVQQRARLTFAGTSHHAGRSSSSLAPTRSTRTTLLQQLQQSHQEWEGDDIRWSSKLRRNVRRSFQLRKQPVRNVLIVLNLVAYLYQIINSVNWIRCTYPSAWPSQAVAIVRDTLTGSVRPGPFTMDFLHSGLFSVRQPHRYLTAGFLHGSIFHIMLNMDALRRLPTWLETGLGAPLYLTTFLMAIVAGNLAHTATALNNTINCFGASGGICGLYGLMYVCLVRMGNHAAAWRAVKGIAILFVVGSVQANVSNAGHGGGFAAGALVGILSGPSYRKSYALRRKNSLEIDGYSRDYRAAMGYDKVPSERGLIPVPLLCVVMLVALSTQAKFRSMPRLILQGLLHPGSLTGLFRS